VSKKQTPSRKNLTKKGRLDSAKDWITKYDGQNLISGYAKWFGVDKICAINELKTLGVIIPENLENQIVESHKRRIEQRKTAKEKTEVFDMAVNDSDDNFAFIAGYTSGGFPYGLTHEEYEYVELDNNDRLDKKNTTA
jgi:3-phosphoglycerate kinase